MNAALLLSAGGAGMLLLMGGAALLLREQARAQRLTERIRTAQRSAGLDVPLPEGAHAGRFLARMVAGLGTTIARSGLLSRKTLRELQETLKSAGFRGPNGLGMFVGSKLLLTIFPPLLAYGLLRDVGLPPLLHNVVSAVIGVVGLLGPDFVVRSIRNGHLKKVEAGLPDALDLMVICAEAGLGLEPALTRVGQEILSANAAMSEELMTTANEMRLNADYRSALLNMGARTGIEGMKRLGATLTQTLQYGTPLTRALRTLSAEMRQEIMTRFEEKAARLPVLLTVPMILFILPCEFLVVGGPAILKVVAVISHR